MPKVISQIAPKTAIEFLSWKGSLARGKFWKAYFALIIPGFVAHTLAVFIQPLFYAWMLNSFWIFTGVLIVFQVIKRLRSTRKSPYLALLLFVPFVNLYVLYLLFIKK